MDNTERFDGYRKKLMDYPVISYQFFNKTNEEIVNDALLRGKDKFCGYSIYRIDEIKIGFYNSRQLLLKSILSERRFQINVTSFNFPYIYPSVHDKQFDNLYCSVDKVSSFENKRLFDELSSLVGQEILITNLWSAFDTTTDMNIRNVINLFSLDEKINERARLIIKELATNRKREIYNILNNPITYIAKYDINFGSFLKPNNTEEFLEPIKQELENQLNLVETYIEENGDLFEEDYDDYDSDYDRKLIEDTNDAMTDGSWKDEIDYNKVYYEDNSDQR